MKKLLLLLLVSLAFGFTTSRQTVVQAADLNWHDVAREVLIDGEIATGTQVLSCDSPAALAILTPAIDKALWLKVEERSVSTLAKEAFKLSADHISATSDAKAAAQSAGKFTRVDGANSSFVYSFIVDGKLFVIRSHTGLTGEMNEAKLWATVPVWRYAMEQHTPDAKAVAQLKAIDKETTITVLFGTWCPDSKYYVPRLLKALHEADNPKLKIKLVGVDNQFHQPLDVVQPRRLINVPTVIAERGGREIGRYIETPATASVEADIAAILNETPLVHLGRMDKGATLGRGVYEYRDAAGTTTGKEQWELYATSDGGYLIRSVITTGALTTEVLQQLDAKKNPSFIEITKRDSDNMTRARYGIENQSLAVTMRGSISGTVKQTLEIPKQLAFVSPSVAAQGWVSVLVNNGEIASYLTPRDFVASTGTLSKTRNTAKGDETIRTPAGEFRTQHLLRATGNDVSEWWLHTQLGIPVRGKLASGVEYVLTAIEIAPKK